MGFEEQKVLASLKTIVSREVLQPIHKINRHYYFGTTCRKLFGLEFLCISDVQPFLDYI